MNLQFEDKYDVLYLIDSDTDIEYRRTGADCWEERMGESWEPVFEIGSGNCVELEKAYQKLEMK